MLSSSLSIHTEKNNKHSLTFYKTKGYALLPTPNEISRLRMPARLGNW